MARPHLLAAALAAATLWPIAASASERPTLRGDILARADVVTLGDLVEHVPAPLAATPVFRAPGLGRTGTIQVHRLSATAEALGLGPLETGGRGQVTITRDARRVDAPAIEAALRAALVGEHGLDPEMTGILFDGPPPALVLGPEIGGAPAVAELSFDRRSRRVAATIWVGPSPAERRGQLRVSGQAVELVSVAVARRGLERGEAVRAGDFAVERRPRDTVPGDAAWDGAPLEGRVARRTLSAGAVTRAADLIRPEIVARGETVTVLYETPGVSLSMRARATEAGTLGDTVGLVNPQSKKALQGVVVGPGRVSVTGALPGRVAAAVQP